MRVGQRGPHKDQKSLVAIGCDARGITIVKSIVPAVWPNIKRRDFALLQSIAMNCICTQQRELELFAIEGYRKVNPVL